MGNKYTFVTVVFEDDYPLLNLQARSMYKYCPKEIVDSVIIIDNSERALPPYCKKRVLAAYGDLATVVKFVSARDISELPQPDSAYGWRTQQVLKLLVSRQILTSRYIILDAKNHLVYPLRRNFLESPDGRARIIVYPYETNHPLRRDLERVLSFLGLDPAMYVRNFTTCAPPFVMYTNVVRELIEYFSIRETCSFENLFIRNKLTEFFLYTGYILMHRINLTTLYSFHQVDCPIVWIGDADEKGCTLAVAIATEQQSPFFGVHRRAILKMNARSRQAIANFWHNRMLFPTNHSAKVFLTKVRIRLLYNRCKRYLISLPQRVLRLSMGVPRLSSE
jgi:hypothetical protein